MRHPPRYAASGALLLAITVGAGLLDPSAEAQVPGRQRTAPLPPMPSASKLPPVEPSVRFTDVARDVEFGYTSNNHFTGRKFFPQPMFGGNAFIDYDNDGWKDIYSSNGDVDYIGTPRSTTRCSTTSRTWPGGKTQLLEKVKVDRVLRVEEPN